MFTMTQANLDALMLQYADMVERAQCVIAYKMAYEEAVNSTLRLRMNGVSDYTRLKSLDLVRELIEKDKIEGNVAEAGVWTGAFARLINYCFPERKIYLFDTFEGFVDEQITNEYNNNNIAAFFLNQQRFDNSSVDIVMNNMFFKEQCIICK